MQNISAEKISNINPNLHAFRTYSYA